MELRHLRYFLAVAKEGNITRAAQQLHIGQPPLSQQIKSLEDELGVKLFQRTPHGVVLTPAGQAFEVQAAYVLEQAEHAKKTARRAAQGEIGQLRLGFTGSAPFNPVVPAAINALKKLFPAVELTMEEANTPQLLQGLVEQRLDAAFIRPASYAPEGLQFYRLADEPMKIALPSTHALVRKKYLKAKDLMDESFILVPGPPGTTLYSEVFELCHAQGFSPRISQPAPQISSVINLVAAGLGISIVPASLSQIRLKGVCYKDFVPPAPIAQLAFAWLDQDNGVVRRLLEIVQRLQQGN